MKYNDLRSFENRPSSIWSGQTGTSITNTSYFSSNHTLEKITTYDDRVEMVFRETSNVTYTNGISLGDKVYKIIVTSKNNKLIYSDKIYGQIVPASGEYFTFED
jgi:hypothetical protein